MRRVAQCCYFMEATNDHCSLSVQQGMSGRTVDVAARVIAIVGGLAVVAGASVVVVRRASIPRPTVIS
jgi:hypothetical protein